VLYSSGEELTFGHSWIEKETFTIKATAKGIFNAESNNTEFPVTIQRHKPFNLNLLCWLFERFPLLERLLI